MRAVGRAPYRAPLSTSSTQLSGPVSSASRTAFIRQTINKVAPPNNVASHTHVTVRLLFRNSAFDSVWRCHRLQRSAAHRFRGDAVSPPWCLFHVTHRCSCGIVFARTAIFVRRCADVHALRVPPPPNNDRQAFGVRGFYLATSLLIAISFGAEIAYLTIIGKRARVCLNFATSRCI
jgi:hypothetical protein